MKDQYTNEPMLDMFLFETEQLISQLEQLIIMSEKDSTFTSEAINDIFRIMHTIKGSSAMMMFNEISTLAHSIEDVFFYLREENPSSIDFSTLTDLILQGIDFIKVEIEKIKNGDSLEEDCLSLTTTIKQFLADIKTDGRQHKNMPNTTPKQQYYIMQDRASSGNNISYMNCYKAVVYFEEGCEMENIRAYTIIHNLKELTNESYHKPENIIDYEDSIEDIRRNGFHVWFKSNESYETVYEHFMQTIFLKELQLIQLDNDEEFQQFQVQVSKEIKKISDQNQRKLEEKENTITAQSIVSVSVQKLDKLMDLVGEMVIAEEMVIQNPDIEGLELENLSKATRQLSKITKEIQEMVMSIRMLPLSTTFLKMHRIVRDMSKKLNKEIELEMMGEDTEVDKNIIEHISDPLMHLVRNAIDHGIESLEDRIAKGKPATGTIRLEAKNSGSEIIITVSDDGGGLDKSKIFKKAKEKGLVTKDEAEMTDREIYQLILLPGFSTRENITEYSGRGVGMDVVLKNIETVGGTINIDSILGKGTTFTLKFPLTLAIIDGMNVKVGNSCFIIPIMSVKESFRPDPKNIITDMDGNEMIMVRGMCYPIIKLYEYFQLKTKVTAFEEGIIIMVEQEDKSICIFADELLGQQQVVVKSLPLYIQRIKKVKGLAGCTLLGDGSISLILDMMTMIYH